MHGEVVGTKRSFYSGEYLGGDIEDYEGQVVEGVHVSLLVKFNIDESVVDSAIVWGYLTNNMLVWHSEQIFKFLEFRL